MIIGVESLIGHVNAAYFDVEEKRNKKLVGSLRRRRMMSPCYWVDGFVLS